MTTSPTLAQVPPAPLPWPGWNAIPIEDRSTGRPLALLILPSIALLLGLAAMLTPSQQLRDAAFICILLHAAYLVLSEFYCFRDRWGFGGLMIGGGILVWFCHDYFSYHSSWSGWATEAAVANVQSTPEWVLCRATFAHALGVWAMTAGLLLPTWNRLINLLTRIPEPRSESVYWIVIIGCFCAGMLPYMLFTAEGPLQAIQNEIFGGRSGGASWTAGRTGDVNFAWSGYLGELIKLGQVGAILAVGFAIFVHRSQAGRLVCFSIFTLWMLLGFGTGTRGNVVFLGVPLLAFMFLRAYQRLAITTFYTKLVPRVSFRAYIGAGLTAFLLLALVQAQGFFRTQGFSNIVQVAQETKLTQLRGNHMFSTTLTGFELIPFEAYYFNTYYPGGGFFNPIPQFIFGKAIHPIPRALWRNKPTGADALWYFYNDRVAGSAASTISHGLVGGAYFRYGFIGILQMCLLFGAMARHFESLGRIALAKNHLMLLLLSLGMMGWLFRGFRGLSTSNLWQLLVGFIACAILVFILNRTMGDRRA